MIDKEIREQLFDPRKAKSKAAMKKKMARLRAMRGKKHRVVRTAHKPQGKPKRWFAAMVKGISERSDVRNPYAIVSSIWAKLTPRKKAQIRKQERSGHVFKYDLPLPQDMATRGTGTVRTVKPFNLSEVQANVSRKDFEKLKKSRLYASMRRNDGSIALVKRCKSRHGNCNIFIDKVR